MDNNTDILEFRRDLFRKARDRLEKMDERNAALEVMGAKSFYKQGGAGGTGGKAIQIEIILNQDKAFIESIDKLIKSTKAEADLQEKLKEAEQKNKQLEQILKDLEDAEDGCD